MLVFFDDILIYSRTWEEHQQYLDEVLGILEDRKIYTKESKFDFSMTEILYLGHVIRENGVQVHQEKIMEIIEWPTPRNVTKPESFLGLYTYYRKFFKGFSQLMTTLTYLTKKGDFSWTDEAHATFEEMKKVMSSCHVLALPDFTHPFVIECDASWIGIGVILMQKNHPIYFER
jgi:hypothetical protein